MACTDLGDFEELAEIHLAMRGGWGYDEKWGRFQTGAYVLSCRDGIAPSSLVGSE